MAASDRQVDIKVKYTADLSDLKKSLSNLQGFDLNIGKTNVKKDLVAPIQSAMRDINKAITAGASGSDLVKLFENLSNSINNAKKDATGLLNSINAGFSSAGNQKLLKDLETYQKELKKVQKQSDDWSSKYGNKAVSKLKDVAGVETATEARKELKILEDQIKKGEILLEQDQARLQALRDYISVLDERKRLQDEGVTKTNFDATISDLNSKIEDILGKVQLPEINTKLNQEVTGLIQELGRAAGLSEPQIRKLSDAINQYQEELKQTEAEGKKTLTRFGDILTGTFLGTSLNSLFQTGLRKGIDFFKEYDETLTRTMMVTGMTREEVNGLTSSYNRLANQLSSTTKDVAAAQLVFYQQGLGTSEALKMTEASIAISKTGGIEAGEAANRLTAAIRGYQMAAKDAMDIADKMSALDANAASSVDELTIAMQKSASQARMAGLDLDYYMAYLSTMQEVTREAPENIGTAMKSITSRLQEITDIGKVEEDGTTFSNVAKALNSVGIAAVDSAGQLRSLQDIMNDLGPTWKTLDRNHKAYIATTLAGNRQQSRFVALMDNYDRAMELVAVSQNASGESARQLRAYNEGLEASFTRLSNAWQQFATNIADSTIIKKIVDTLSDLVETINKLPKGLTSTVVLFTAFSKVASTISKIKFDKIGPWALSKIGFGEIIKDTKDLGAEAQKTSRVLDKTVSSLSKWFNSLDLNFGKMKRGAEDVADGMNIIESSAAGASVATSQLNITKAQTAGIVAGESQITEEYGKVSEEAAEEVSKIGVAVDSNKKAMDSNDGTMKKEIEDTIHLGTVQEEIRLKTEESQARSVIALTKQEIEETYERYKNEIDKIIENYRTNNPSDFNKVFGRYKASKTRAAKRAGGSGQQELDLGISEWEEQAQYLSTKIPEIGEKIGEATASFQEQIDGLNRVLVREEEYSKAMHEASKALRTKTSSSKKSAEADEKEAEASEQAAEADLLEAEASEQAANADLKEGANVPAVSNTMLGNVNLTNIKNAWSSQSLKNTDKLSKTVKELSKGMNVASIASGVMIGSFVNMGAKAIGLDSDLSKALGTFIGFGKTLSGFGIAGWAVAAGIAGIQLALDKMYPSAERTREEISKLQKKMDELKQKETDLSGYIETYNELSTKLTRTEEETSQLKDATDALAKSIPGVVSGYDSYGNALINTTRAMKELEVIQNKQVETASKTLDQYGKLQKNAQNSQKQWTIWGTIIGTVLTAAGLLLELPTAGLSTALTTVGVGMLAGSAASGVEMSMSQRAENKKVIEENYNDIYAQILTIEGQFVDKLAAEHQDTADRIMKTLATSMLEAARTSGSIYLDDLNDELVEIFGSFDGVLMNEIEITLQSLDIALDVRNMNYDEARKYILEKVGEELKKAGFEGSQLEAIVNVILDVKFDAAIDVAAARDAIYAKITELGKGNNKYKTILADFAAELGQLDNQTLQIMDNLGLLSTEFAGVFNKIQENGFKNNTDIGITEFFRDQEGQIDSTLAALRTYETALDNIEIWQDVANFESEDKYVEQAMELRLKNLKELGMTYEQYYGMTQKEGEEELRTAYQRSAEALNYWKKTADTAYAAMESKLIPSFKEVSQALKDTKENFDALNSVAEHLDDTKGILDVDALTGIFDIFSSFEDSALDSVESWNAWANALDAVNNGIVYENGLLKLNEEALSGVNSMIQESTKAKYRRMVADIEEAQNSLKLQKSVLEAELNTVTIQIQSLEDLGKENYKEAEFEKETKEALQEDLNSINLGQIDSEQDKVQKILEINQAGFNQLLAMQKQYENKENASFTLKDYSGEYEKAVEKFKKDRTSNLLSLITDSYDDTLASLQHYQESLRNQIAVLDGQILQGDVEKRLFQDIIDGKVDLSKTMNFGNASDSVKDYNEQLERTLSLIERIEGLQHKIEENSTFKDLYEGYSGKDYGRLMMQNLDLAKEQYEVYKELFAMQQEMTNQAAGDLLDSPYGQMFKIMENGDIGWADASMYDKYKSLPNDMQEDIDNLVEAFQNQRDALRDTESELTKYAKEVKSVREELVRIEIEIENELVGAIKNREKILHDARMKALDDEISMIEEAVDKRRKARETDKSNKELYDAQEKLRRATLDSSGKNNATLLQLQQELEDKQLEIAEKRFEDDMEDRKQWLQDTKDAETETYEYRLETMTWYWEQVQAVQEAGQEAMMQTLISWNEEYRVQSELQQKEMVREWQFNMDAMKEATDMGAELDALTSGIVSVTQTVESMDISIQKLPGTWQKATDAANTYIAAAQKAATYSGTAPIIAPQDDTGKDPGPTGKDELVYPYKGSLKQGMEVELDYEDYAYLLYSDTKGTSFQAIRDSKVYDKNVKILSNAKWSPELQTNLIQVEVDGKKGWMKPSADKYGQGLTKYFHDKGWFQSGTKYATGGMVDYTGPAWVDGTTTRPEAFLSAYQTEQVGALAEALSRNGASINTLSGDSNVTFGSITFNVASMSSAADGKEALDTFVRGANELMAKKGVNTKLNLNMK